MTQSPPVCVAKLPVDAAVDAPDAFTGCMTNNDCAVAANPVCDTTTHACRGCRADAECGSVCTEYNGQCEPDGRSIFVSASGDDTTNCSRQAPCRSFAKAQAEITNNKRTIVVLDGSYSSSGSVLVSFGTTGGRVVISGEDNLPDGAFLSAMSNGTTNPQIVNIANGTDVVIEGVTIRNGGQDGVRNFGALLLYRDAITGNNSRGVLSNPSNNAPLHIWESLISGNGNEGINAQKGPVEILRSIVELNTGGGLFIGQGATTIANSMFVQNGSATGNYGGIRLQMINGLAVSLSFLTVADNLTNSTNVGGIDADATVAVSSSIFANNTGPSQLCSGCTATYSLFTSTPPIGTGNLMGAPSFASTTDYHIAAGSPAIDAADPGATIRDDIDGDARPQGSGFDMGADEL